MKAATRVRTKTGLFSLKTGHRRNWLAGQFKNFSAISANSLV